MSLARCALAVAMVRGLGAAQESQPATRPAGLETLEQRVLTEVRAGLKSTDGIQLAWAAWHTGTLRLSPLAFDVERALLRLVQGPAIKNRYLVSSSLCDALIALDVDLLPKTFREAWDREPFIHEALMVLVARHPRDHLPQLRAIAAAKQPDRSWLCACNLLLDLDPKALTAALLDQLTLEVRFHALDPGVDPDQFWDRDDEDAGGIGTTIYSAPPGFPPMVHTRLDIVTQPGATERILARGPVHIAWIRNTGRGQLTHCEFVRPMRVAARSVEYLIHLADSREQATQLDATQRRDVPWQDAARWKAECQELLALLRAQWSAVTIGLQRKGLLPAASPTPDVFRIHTLDQRRDKTTPLPRIE